MLVRSLAALRDPISHSISGRRPILIPMRWWPVRRFSCSTTCSAPATFLSSIAVTRANSALRNSPAVKGKPGDFWKAPFIARSYDVASCHRCGRDNEVMRTYGGSFERKLRGQSGVDTGSHQIK